MERGREMRRVMMTEGEKEKGEGSRHLLRTQTENIKSARPRTAGAQLRIAYGRQGQT